MATWRCLWYQILLSKIETKVYFFFKGDRSFDYCSRSYFWIVLAASITLESETARKELIPSWQNAFSNKAKEETFLCKISSSGSTIFRGCQPQRWGRKHIILANFHKNSIQFKTLPSIIRTTVNGVWLWIFEWVIVNRYQLIHDDDWTFAGMDIKIGSPIFYAWGLKSIH